ncbi:MAG TPA: dihydroorotate dehydrogenase [Phycisphaerales bacterium]|nr:dihydroorotate dehydrogenase [Phycisphaerales bacterium]HMP37454.1 dihydroorotate dehydrogenase [Phycisphaerales bacterium]
MSALFTNFAGIPLRNPVVAAAGTCGYVDEIADAIDPALLGAIISKSITRHSRGGNPPWRMVGLPGAMFNAIGLANVGVERFIAEKLPAAERLGTVLVASIAGNSVEDYVAIAAALDERSAVQMAELNVSCPNTVDGLMFGEDPASLLGLLREVRPALGRTKMLVKLSPNVSDIVAMAAAAIEGGADGLSLINTISAMSIDVRTRLPRLSNGRGGLSGPAIHPIAVRMVHDVHRSVARDAGVPILGVGGVMCWEDAAEFILAGATAVGMGTALFVDPRRPLTVLRGLERWVRDQGCANVAELIGAVRPPAPAAAHGAAASAAGTDGAPGAGRPTGVAIAERSGR